MRRHYEDKAMAAPAAPTTLDAVAAAPRTGPPNTQGEGAPARVPPPPTPPEQVELPPEEPTDEELEDEEAEEGEEPPEQESQPA
jgi:hypothetical protein